MLWVYDHYSCISRRQNLASTDVYGRQIMTSKDGARTASVKVNSFFTDFSLIKLPPETEFFF